MQEEQRRERFAAHGVLTRSKAMDPLLEMIERVAGSQANVLIEGESGTGKELVARAIHALSGRTPFVALNCAALPETLLESELFGHERGAFTGADRARVGLVAQASGGTLFLDEVCEMAPTLQAKLLRVLEEKEVRSIGGTSSRRVDLRIVAATNVPTRDACLRGTLRLDLYHRLAVVPLHLPPLRERRGDVPLLVEHFLTMITTREGRSIRRVERDALRILEGYGWPGNVRELQNEMQRLVVCARNGDVIRKEALSPWIAPDLRTVPGDSKPLREVLREVEISTIHARLQQHNYRRAATARSLGITREALWAKLRQLGLAGACARPVNGRPVLAPTAQSEAPSS